MLDAGLGVVHEHTRIDAAQPRFPLEQECEVFPVGLRFDAEEPGQALLVEEGRGERVGGRETPHGITRSSWRAPQVEHGAAVVTFGTPAHRFLKSLKKRRMGCPR